MNAVQSKERSGADLAAIVRPGLYGILASKVDVVDDVLLLAQLLDERQSAAGLAAGSVRIIAAIESARGLLSAPAIAACSPRVVGLMFGAEDIGLATLREDEAAELMYARSSMVIAAVAAHKLSFDGVWPDIGDADGLRRDTLRARRLGFSGKTLIHPGRSRPSTRYSAPASVKWSIHAESSWHSKKRRPAAMVPSRSADSCWTRLLWSARGGRSSFTRPS